MKSRDAAAIAGVTTTTIRQWVCRGHITATKDKTGHLDIDLDSLNLWINDAQRKILAARQTRIIA